MAGPIGPVPPALFLQLLLEACTLIVMETRFYCPKEYSSWLSSTSVQPMSDEALSQQFEKEDEC